MGRVIRYLGVSCFCLVVACGSEPSFEGDGGKDGGGGKTGGSSSGGDDGGGLQLGGSPGSGGDGAGGSVVVSPCGDVFCTREQSCKEQNGEATCVPNTCEELACNEAEECVTTSLGAYCQDLTCNKDLDCSAERYCNEDERICKDDTCVPGTRSCSPDGQSGADSSTVYVCRSNGGGFREEASCASATVFTSVCVEAGAADAGCSCGDDWDCPGYQECEAGTCQGSLDLPSCMLQPAEIDEVLPSKEVVWGTAPGAKTDARLRVVDGSDVPSPGEETGAPGELAAAELSPFSDYVQATQTPIVANLTDDNGDGLIDERDVAEVLFLAFKDGKENNDGVLRALRGGGADDEGRPLKGRDYLAVCGESRWLNGTYYDTNDTALGSEPACGSAQGEFDPASTLAVGDLDYDGKPEIVVFGEEDNNDGFNTKRGRFSVYDHEGRRLLRSSLFTFQNIDSSAENPGPSLANVVAAAAGEDEMAELVIGRDLFTLSIDDQGVWSVSGRYEGGEASGVNQQGPVSCVADLIPGRPGMEIVSGASVYGIPLDGSGLDTSSATLVTLASGSEGFCAVADVWGSDLARVPGPSNGLDESPELVVVHAGKLSVYAVEASPPATSAEEWTVGLVELTEDNGVLRDLPGNQGGGAPNVDDFDGDGFPEIGTAGPAGYIVFDLQTSTGSTGSCPDWTSFADDQTSNARSAPAGSCKEDADCNGSADPSTWNFACNERADVGQGTCVCLHNGWQRLTQDGSSKVTGSSVFDFNGDGAAEVIYNDECHFRMYSGVDGAEVFLEESESRTRIEYPIVADVDNDGNAEIVFATSTESGFCNRASYSLDCTDSSQCPSGDQPNGQKCIGGECQVQDAGVFNAGIEIWGDLSDRWVSARRIWNQYSYHVTNVNESGAIPMNEPSSWLPLGARLYNTYRSQPRSFGSAPDLVVRGMQVIAPGSCGQGTDLTIGAEIVNQGDLRVSGVPVRFYGTWESEMATELLTDDAGEPLERVITQSLEPGASVILQVTYRAEDNERATFPDMVRVVVDPAQSGDGLARECHEDNNSAESGVDADEPRADLRLVLENPNSSCPPPVRGTVFNDSVVAAGDVVVRIYAGDPATGGLVIGDLEIGAVQAGASVDFDSTDLDPSFAQAFPTNRPVRLYGRVDPDDTVPECNEANNQVGPTAATTCEEIK